MSHFTSHLNTWIRSSRFTRRGSTRRPSDVPTGVHKTYPRMQRIDLPEPQALSMSLSDTLSKRTSLTHECGMEALTLTDVSSLFGHSLRGHAGSARRRYPSGGALFPIETYMIITRSSEIQPGVFHYHPTDHAFEFLWELPDDFNMSHIISRPSFLQPSALIIFTSVWERSSAKYGDFTYNLALLEAGHMSENILLSATALRLEARPMAGFDDRICSRLLDLNDDDEQPIHTIALSKSLLHS